MPRVKKTLELDVKRIAPKNWGIYKVGRKSPLEDDLRTREDAIDVARHMAYTENMSNRPVTVRVHRLNGGVSKETHYAV